MITTTHEIKAAADKAEGILEIAKALTTLAYHNSDDELGTAAFNVQRAAERLRERAERLRQVGEATLSRVKRNQEWWNDNFGPWYSGISELGELQGGGSAFDVACALYTVAFEELNTVVRRRARAEEKAARATRRLAYTGELKRMLDYLELHLGHQLTPTQLGKALTRTPQEIDATIKELLSRSIPFLIRRLNRHGGVRSVCFKPEGVL